MQRRVIERFPQAIPPSGRHDQGEHDNPSGAGYYSVTIVRFRVGSEPWRIQVNIGIGCKEQLYEGSYDVEAPVTMWPLASLELVMDESFNDTGVWRTIDERDESMNETDRSWGESASPAD